MFQIGDTVRLKSGGPLMTVSLVTDKGEVRCLWFTSTDSAEISTVQVEPATLKSENLPTQEY